jgi:hypothetical protein
MDNLYDYLNKRNRDDYDIFSDDDFDYEYSDELFYEGYVERDEYEDFDDYDY